VSETISETAGKVVWFELPADDTARARTFYGGLFDWQFEQWDGPTEYHTTGGGAIKPANGKKGALVYFGTDDIDASVARVRELGGIASDAQEIPGVGRFSACVDTEGNPFALYQSGAVV
jgi:predicted enzyme related to lactoylglutathione lyase